MSTEAKHRSFSSSHILKHAEKNFLTEGHHHIIELSKTHKCILHLCRNLFLTNKRNNTLRKLVTSLPLSFVLVAQNSSQCEISKVNSSVFFNLSNLISLIMLAMYILKSGSFFTCHCDLFEI